MLVSGQKLVYLVSFMGCKYAGPFIHLARQLIGDNVSEGVCVFEIPLIDQTFLRGARPIEVDPHPLEYH